MGKKARLKKEVRVQQTLQEKALILQRQKEARAPQVVMLRRLIVAIVVTIALFYIGQVINHRLALAAPTIEVNQ